MRTRNALTNRGKRSALIGVAMGVFWMGVVRADLPTARLLSLTPRGASPGGSVDIVLGGGDLDGVSALLFSRPGLASTTLPDGKQRVTVAKDTAPGFVEVRAAGPWGVSNPRPLLITPLPAVAEKEPNNLVNQATRVPLDCVIDGVFEARADLDYFRVPVTKGTRVIIECFAERLDSRSDPVLTVNTASGQWITNQNHVGKDPVLDLVAPTDGDWVIGIFDLVNDGSAEHFYRLAIHRGPMIEFAYPPSAAPGTKGSLQLVGRHLPGGRPFDAAHGLESVSQAFEMPSESTRGRGMDQLAALMSRGFASQVVAFPSPFTGGVGLPFAVGLARHPVAMETEPNDTVESATIINPPVEIVGRHDRSDDHDWFRFKATKGQVLQLEAVAERMGVDADLWCLLQRVVPRPGAGDPKIQVVDVAEFDDDSANVGRFKFNTQTHDPRALWTAPETADYVLEVADRQGSLRHDGKLVYRLSLGPPQPDFQLVATPVEDENPSSTNVRQGGTTWLQVFAQREGGFADAIHLEAASLPTGVTASGAVIAPNQTEAPFVLIAADNAPAFSGRIEIRGKSTIGGKEVTRVARAGVIRHSLAPTGPKPARFTDGLYLSVRENAPYRLKAKPRETLVGQGSQVAVALELTRRWKEFTTPLEGIAAVGIPPNVDSPPAVIAANQNVGVSTLIIKPDAPPGSYTYLVRGTGQVPFTKTPADPKATRANVPVADPSEALSLTIVPRPVELRLPAGIPKVKVGGKTTVKVVALRHNGFAGPLKLELTLPPGGTGLTAAPIEVSATQTSADVTIECAAGVAPGDRPSCTIRATALVGNQPVTTDVATTIQVIP